MKWILPLIFLFMLFGWDTSSATVINIPADYSAIQQGIDASIDGDTVLVQPGTYVENINFNGHNIVLGSLFLTTGDTSYIEETVIDGDSGQTGGPLVRFSSGEDNTAIIIGFAIQNNIGIYEAEAGGVYCNNSSPSIKYNIIRDNNIISGGGGIYCVNHASPIIENNIIEGNSSTESNLSGGIYCGGYSNPVIVRNVISENWGEIGGGIGSSSYSNPQIMYNKINYNGTFMFGGGISCWSSNAVIIGNEFIGNTALYYGGGIYCNNPANILIANNIIVANRARARGAGIYFKRIDPIMINNDLYRNIADSAGGGLYIWDSNPLLINNIFRADSIGYPNTVESQEIYADSGSPVVEYCNIQRGWPGTGNIDIDPLFRDPAGGDFHLMSIICGDTLDSPCIDAGSPYYSDSLIDCSWGLGTTASDMGAYGGGDTAYVNIWDTPSSLPERFLLLQNYPNPFNARTTIRFALATESDIDLSVYNLLGQKVSVLYRGIETAGYHSLVWDAVQYPSGVYFALLKTDENSKSIKIILMK